MSRLSEMGEMASELAHELNQPLTAIITYMQACRSLFGDGAAADVGRVGELIDKAIGQAERAGQIIQHLRRFIARGETDRSAEEISGVVEEAARLALSGLRHRASTPFPPRVAVTSTPPSRSSTRRICAVVRRCL